jgi:hypothetical protein
MHIILNTFCFIIGLISGGIIIMIPLMIVFFDIPYTLKLMRDDAINGAVPIAKGVFGVMFYTIIFYLIKSAVYSWLNTGISYYWAGVALGLIICIRKCRSTPESVSNYRKDNCQYYK